MQIGGKGVGTQLGVVNMWHKLRNQDAPESIGWQELPQKILGQNLNKKNKDTTALGLKSSCLKKITHYL
jgi:hypothetical protein